MIRRAAFTLVEMMVALAVTGVLTVMMLQMFSDSSTIWKTEDDRLDTFREARAALQIMARDFTSAMPLPNATAVGITENFPALALRDLQKRSVAGLSKEYYTSAYMLTATPNGGLGDLCAVGYRLEWEPSIDPQDSAAAGGSATPSPPPPRTAFALLRQMSQSNTTFARLRETLPLTPAGTFFGDNTFKTLYSKDKPTTPSGTNVPLPKPVTEKIGTYIWDLQFSVSTEPPTTPIPSATPSSTPAPGKNGFYGTKLPAWVEIRFKALGSTATRKLNGNPLVTEELWSKPDDEAYKRLILPAEQQFITRVKLSR